MIKMQITQSHNGKITKELIKPILDSYIYIIKTTNYQSLMSSDLDSYFRAMMPYWGLYQKEASSKEITLITSDNPEDVAYEKTDYGVLVMTDNVIKYLLEEYTKPDTSDDNSPMINNKTLENYYSQVFMMSNMPGNDTFLQGYYKKISDEIVAYSELYRKQWSQNIFWKNSREN